MKRKIGQEHNQRTLPSTFASQFWYFKVVRSLYIKLSTIKNKWNKTVGNSIVIPNKSKSQRQFE